MKLFNILSYTLLAAFALGLGSCATSNDVVSERAVQKRKYRKGFYVDARKQQKSVKPADAVLVDEAPVAVYAPKKAEVKALNETLPTTEARGVELAAARTPITVTAAPSAKELRREVKADVKAARDFETVTSSSPSPEAALQFAPEMAAASPSAAEFKSWGIKLIIAGLVLVVVAWLLAVSIGGGTWGIWALFSSLGGLAILIGLIFLLLYFLD